MKLAPRSPAWVRPLRSDAGPRYLQIAGWIREAVAAGVLRPGERLPAQRVLASHLQVDLTTITRAYAEARHQNLLESVGGSGCYVSAREHATGPTIDLSMNIPPPPQGVRVGELLGKSLQDVLGRANADALMSYHAGAGSAADRAAGALWLQPLLGNTDPSRLIISSGAQLALASLLGALTSSGETVLAPRLCYPGFLSAAQVMSRRVVPLDSDEHGVLPQSLLQASVEHRARVVYLNPTLNNPTTTTLPVQRRQELARIAEQRQLILIEDDPYGLLLSEAPPALATLLPQRTWYVATVSKCLTPGLRVAFIVAPEKTDATAVLQSLRGLSLMAPPLMSAVLTRWIRDGQAARVLQGVRQEARARQNLARRWLPADSHAHPEGLHVWLPLPARWSCQRLVQAAREQGLGVSAADAFNVGGEVPQAVRICLGGVAERARLDAALQVLAEVLRSAPGVDTGAAMVV